MKTTTGRERKLPPFVLGLATVASLMLGATSIPSAAPVPDAAALEHLRAEAAARNRFRVMTGSGEFLASAAFDVDASGVRVAGSTGRAALIVTGVPANADRRIAWERVERIEGMRSHGLRDGFIGSVVGSVLGIAFASWLEHNYGLRDNEALFAFVIPVGLCAGLGALHGTTTGWERIYP